MLRVWATHSQVDVPHPRTDSRKPWVLSTNPTLHWRAVPDLQKWCPLAQFQNVKENWLSNSWPSRWSLRKDYYQEGTWSGNLESSCNSRSQTTAKVLADDLEIPPVALNREKLSIFIPREENLKKLALGSYKHSWWEQYLTTIEWHFSFTSLNLLVCEKQIQWKLS